MVLTLELHNWKTISMQSYIRKSLFNKLTKLDFTTCDQHKHNMHAFPSYIKKGHVGLVHIFTYSSFCEKNIKTMLPSIIIPTPLPKPSCCNCSCQCKSDLLGLGSDVAQYVAITVPVDMNLIVVCESIMKLQPAKNMNLMMM